MYIGRTCQLSHVADFTGKSVKEIEVSAPVANKIGGKSRNFSFYDESGAPFDFIQPYGLSSDVTAGARKSINERTDLIGFSLAMDEQGFVSWINFLVYPKDKPIL